MQLLNILILIYQHYHIKQ